MAFADTTTRSHVHYRGLRDWLDKGSCDVVMGLDAGDERVLTTTPYYRTGYVFVTRADSKLAIANWQSEDLAKASHIGFVPGTPAQAMLEQRGLFHQWPLRPFGDR